MERNVPGLLFIHLVFFVLSAPPCAASPARNISKVVLIPIWSEWKVAQNYCRYFHDDLVTIRTQQEAIELAPYEGWFGLHRSPSWSWSWTWTSGDKDVIFDNWDTAHPRTGFNCAWKLQSRHKWESDHCDAPHPFMCDERLIVFQEEKTWEEALEHCRAINYHLVSLPKARTFLFNRKTIKKQATTNEVWVGLRFLAGEWLWLGGRKANISNLLHCPVQQQHCGAMLRDKEGFVTLNCGEKRNFLCGKKR